MLAAPLRMLDQWCAHAELAAHFWSWLVGIAIVAPLAAWAALAVVRGLDGLALAAPRCIRCRHLNVAGASERCTECGHALSDGTAWTRRKPMVRDAVRGVIVAACLLAMGIAIGGLVFALMTDRLRRWPSSTAETLEHVLRAGSEVEIAMALDAEHSKSRTPEARARLFDVIRREADLAPEAARRMSRDPALRSTLAILGDVASDDVVAHDALLRVMDTLGALPQGLVPQVLPAASQISIEFPAPNGVRALVRDVSVFTGDGPAPKRSLRTPTFAVPTPATFGRATVTVAWDVAIADGTQLTTLQSTERFESTFDVFVLPVVSRFVVAALERNQARSVAFNEMEPTVEYATMEHVGNNALLHVNIRHRDPRASSIAMIGRWHALLHSASGDATRDVSIPLHEQVNQGELVGRVPVVDGAAVWPPPFSHVTLNFEPDVEAVSEWHGHVDRWQRFIVPEPWRSDRVTVEPLRH